MKIINKNKKNIIGLFLMLVIGLIILFFITTDKSLLPASLKNVTVFSQIKDNPKFGFNELFIETLINPNTMEKDREMVALAVKETGGTWLRFPGGTPANTYVPDLTAPGMGRDTLADKRMKNNFAVDYADFVTQYLPKTKTTYVLNMAAHFPTYYGGVNLMPPRLKNKTEDQIIAMNLSVVEYLLDRSIEIPYIELGNELYLHNLSANRNLLVQNKNLQWVTTIMKPEMDKYERLSNKYITELNKLAERKSKELNKNISFKYGAPYYGPQDSPQDYLGLHAMRNYYWDTRISNMKIDAVVPHFYTSNAVCKTIDNLKDVLLFDECLRTKGYDYVKRLPDTIDKIKKNNTQKEIWVTEFNIWFGDAQTNQLIKTTFPNSSDHINMVRSMVETFESKNIELYMFHALYLPAQLYSIVNNLPQVNQTINTRVDGTSLKISPIACALIKNNKNLSCQF